MYVMDTFKDLKIDIDISKMNIDRLKNEKKIYESSIKGPSEIGCQQYSDMPKGSKKESNYAEAFVECSRIEARIEREELLLKGMLDQKEKMLKQLEGTEGVLRKILFKKYVENKTHARIAQELDMSERNIYRVIAREKNKKKMSLQCHVFK